MLVVDGYKMTQGEATIRINGREIHTDGVFLYRPDTDQWTVAPCMAYPWGGTFGSDEIIEIREVGRT